MARMDPFTRAYFEAALWSTTDESDDQGGEPLEKDYGIEDFDPATRDKMIADCADFQERFGELIADDEPTHSGEYSDSELAGHDFWLTRNGHGAGFWDGDWPKHGDELTEASKEYGEFYLYVGDDGQIYGPPEGAHGVREASHHVADFNTLDDLIEHARGEGATHIEWEHDLHGNKLYFPRKDGQYEKANIWQKGGYWHAAGPSHREIVRHLPRGAVPIGGAQPRRAAESRFKPVGPTHGKGRYSSRQNPEKALINDVFLDGYRIGYISGPFSYGGKKDFWEWRLDSVSPDSYPPFGLSPASGRAKTRQSARDALIHADKARVALHGHIRYSDPGSRTSEAPARRSAHRRLAPKRRKP